MKMAGIRELRAQSSRLLNSREPVLVTRHGKISGLFLPLSDPDTIPDDIRRELADVLGKHLCALLALAGVSEEDIMEDFDAHRSSRR